MLQKLAPALLALAAGCSVPRTTASEIAVEWPAPWHSRQLYTAGDYTLLATSARDAAAGLRMLEDVMVAFEGHVEFPPAPGLLLVYAEHDPTSEFELDLLLEHLAKGEPTVDRESEDEFNLGQGTALKLAAIPLDAARVAEYLGREELGELAWALTMPSEAAVKASMRKLISAQAEAEGMPLAMRALMPLALPLAYRYLRDGVIGRLLLHERRPDLSVDEIERVLAGMD